MRRFACCAAVVFAAAACAADDRVPISDEEAHDLAMSLASTLRPPGGGGELGAMLDVAVIARGGTPTGFAPDADGTMAGQHLGLAYRYQLACRDAHNRTLPACDARTDNADVVVSWQGILDLPALVMVIERDGAWILNDITPARLRLDGDGTMTYESRVVQRDGSTATYQLAYEASHRAIMLAPDDDWPHAGTIRYALTATRSRDGGAPAQTRELTVRAELRFVAGGIATIALDGARTYRVDLATGAVERTE